MKVLLQNLGNIRSIIVLSLIITLNIAIIKEIHPQNDLFLLFSNLITMVMTYFFLERSRE